MSNQDPNFQRAQEILAAPNTEAEPAAFGLPSTESGAADASYDADIRQAMEIGNSSGASKVGIEVQQVPSDALEATIPVNRFKGYIAAGALVAVAFLGAKAQGDHLKQVETVDQNTQYSKYVDGPTIGQNSKGGPVVIHRK